jgi:hypothetical protein
MKFSKQFTLASPLSPDEMMAKLKEPMAAYPYDSEPYSVSTDGYSFVMQRITKAMREGWSSRKQEPAKTFGKVMPDGRGSIITVTTGKNWGFIILLVFIVIGLLLFMMSVLLAGFGAIPLIAFPVIIYAMSYNRMAVNLASTKVFLYLLLKGGDVSNI